MMEKVRGQGTVNSILRAKKPRESRANRASRGQRKRARGHLRDKRDDVCAGGDREANMYLWTAGGLLRSVHAREQKMGEARERVSAEHEIRTT